MHQLQIVNGNKLKSVLLFPSPALGLYLQDVNTGSVIEVYGQVGNPAGPRNDGFPVVVIDAAGPHVRRVNASLRRKKLLCQLQSGHLQAEHRHWMTRLRRALNTVQHETGLADAWPRRN